jgi:cell division protein FtsN
MAWRTFAILLFALNVAAFAFAWFNPVPAPALVSATEADIAPLVLLAERDEAQMRATANDNSPLSVSAPATAMAPTAIPVSTPQAQYCERIGAFTEESEAASMRARLGSLTSAAEVKAVEELQLRGYWVYLAQSADRESALKRARQLSAAGIKDYYVVTEGTNENTISLGMFRDAINADKRIAQLTALGFDAKRIERGDKERRYWVEYRAATESKPMIAAMRGMDALKRETIFCDAAR